MVLYLSFVLSFRALREKLSTEESVTALPKANDVGRVTYFDNVAKGASLVQEANKAIVRRMIEAIQNSHQLDRMEEFFHPNFANHLEDGEPPAEGSAIERARRAFGALFAAFPDLHVSIRCQVAEGDQVVTHKLFRGTHRGEFMGVPATGRPIEFAVIDILRLEDGKVAEHWAVQDRLALMQQLGLLAAAEPA
jgi:steroid delta-isomerase-like uncharacterized protein